MIENQENLKKLIKKIEEDESNTINKKWNEDIFLKLILLFPLIIFLSTFLKFNNDKNIFDLLIFVFSSIVLVIGGVILNFLLTKK